LPTAALPCHDDAWYRGRYHDCSHRGGGIGGLTPALDPGIDEQFMFYPTRAQ
jgi:hypothetical protein